MLDELFKEFENSNNDNGKAIKNILMGLIAKSKFNKISIRKKGNAVETDVDGDFIGILMALAQLITRISKESEIPLRLALEELAMFAEALDKDED